MAPDTTQSTWQIITLASQVVSVSVAVVGYVFQYANAKSSEVSMERAGEDASLPSLPPPVSRDMLLALYAMAVFVVVVGLATMVLGLTATDLATDPPASLRRNLFAGALGGPIVLGLYIIGRLFVWTRQGATAPKRSVEGAAETIRLSPAVSSHFYRDPRFQPDSRSMQYWEGCHRLVHQNAQAWGLGPAFLERNTAALESYVHKAMPPTGRSVLSPPDYDEISKHVRKSLDEALEAKMAHTARRLANLNNLTNAALYVYGMKLLREGS